MTCSDDEQERAASGQAGDAGGGAGRGADGLHQVRGEHPRQGHEGELCSDVASFV